MPSLAFPLRLENGFLRRTSDAEAILSLLGSMARTPRGSWRACPEYGIQDLLEQAARQKVRPELVVQRVNEALEQLGIANYRLESLQLEAGSPAGTAEFTAVLADNSGSVTVWSNKTGN